MERAWQRRTVEIDGVPTHYLEAGQGLAVVLVHGGGATSCAEFNYGDAIGPLSRHVHVFAPDLVGFGRTPPRGPQDYSAAAQGEFLVRFLRWLDRPVVVGGNSHGGWLAQYAAHEAPDLVQGLIIINSLNGTSPIPPPPEGLKYIFGPQGHRHEEPTRERIRASLSDLYVRQELVTEERVDMALEIARLNHAFARARAQATSSTVEDANRDLMYRGAHISEHAGELRVPVLLTWSRENPGATPADAARFLDRLQTGELHVLTGAGHHVMTEFPERWAEVVVGFLRHHRLIS